jgi:hypothetical protein
MSIGTRGGLLLIGVTKTQKSAQKFHLIVWFMKHWNG